MSPEEIERLLGDPYDDTNPYGFAAAVARDERDAFPDELCAELVEAGFHLNYLLPQWDGRFETFDRSMLLVRTAARRDLNVMPSTMFGITAATCLALHGSPEQRKQAAAILTRGGAIGFALSEAGHGSDLLSNTARLEPTADGWELTGEKWMVGLGRRCEAVYLVARTGERGPGAFSAVLLDLTGNVGVERGPAVPASGMRGIDFAHLRFDRFPVPADALVGREGQALESVMKAQQVVRVMSMAGSLGCADTALRLTLDFAAGRRAGRTTVLASAYPRRELAVASAALLAADATALAAARGIHAAPETFSVWGCAAKHVVAESAEETIRRCGTVLATRSVLRTEGPGGGLFQKLQRDAAVVRVVDTSTLANLRSFAGQLPAVSRAVSGPVAPDTAQLVRTVFDLSAPLPAYAPERLDLSSRGHDPVTAALGSVAPEALARLTAQGEHGTAHLVTRLAAAVAGLSAEVDGADRDTGLVDLAERFAWLHAATCCLHLWWANPAHPRFTPAWLGACLAHLLARAEGTDPRREGAAQLPALDITAELHAGNHLFSAVPVKLAP
ncbi:acyl-CoA dehydrogenase [Streptomyces viridochromogenes]|uniref:Acyl-CoA dehydrogenase n=1 Tax=Streptomyces viridochromogenes TaxID=1938 RepID=A0A0J7Z049_STRVR|nr:acyl-CoA dehydrogenase [Streptomyces viridochromogenes]KMS68668.1 acyl-CoA dehydrogenase [Streptomyces viridochromogenes]KOG11509.1 acyl-CoA dehydrogenase [Streptomyces viridochromogenes]KOG11552.1 acyl-CoA dehydrogenase [Streptomyces viridochromogenes]